MSLYLENVGLIMLGGVFVCAGIEHFLRFRQIAAQLPFPYPRLMLAAGSALEIVAGLCLAVGVGRPYAALALIAFTIAASLMMLNFWSYSGPERQSIRSAFTINIAVVGGLLLAAAAPGQWT
ncbi:DoxX family membrane protein [Chelativorans sp. YIM 93263]|uniref:DoxX family membrane protein n=1 Tax=Chelativorans sp. YIM 93263 TaxID=2906648 RepID=UPI0023780934|nr:DoxX family protein [Chelativorans sp. YIM 93263]